jgi:hypothetical protein
MNTMYAVTLVKQTLSAWCRRNRAETISAMSLIPWTRVRFDNALIPRIRFPNILSSNNSLKGESQEIFDPQFFSPINCSLIIILKYFRIWFLFCRDIREYMYVDSALHIAQSRQEKFDMNFTLSCKARSRKWNFLYKTPRPTLCGKA